MKNPLNKRLPRELFGELGRYLVIFLFMTLTIAFISGFIVAADSLKAAYDGSFEKYSVEDGHFELKNEAKNSLLTKLEEEDMDIYPLFFKNVDVDADMDGQTDGTIRIYAPRQEVNRVCLMDGSMPETSGEIAIDRMYADNNKLSVGDHIILGGETLMVTGLVALPDYSCLFSDNNDLMFDSLKFCVAIMTQEGYNVFPESKEHYNYAWLYHDPPADDAEANDRAEDFIEALVKVVSRSGNRVEEVLPRYINNAITFTGDDMGSDRTMMIVLLYILIAILAFVFAVTIKQTIIEESAVIGTLRASGYTKGELFRHYMMVPMLVTLAAALIGNIFGYTVFEDIGADMYYGSYSLTTYVTLWNMDAFSKTTIVPLIIMFVVNSVVLISTLKLSPLRFIRRDIGKNKRKKALRLPKFSFFTRFRIRVMLQNISGYLVLLIGIMFVSLLLLFGMIMEPLLNNYQDVVVNNMISDYQYILKTQVETENTQAEKYCMTSLTYDTGKWSEEISIYGIVENSIYIKDPLPEEGVLISDGYAEKYGLHTGDQITLKESYGNETYTFKVSGMIYFPTGLAIFMGNQQFIDIFQPEVNTVENLLTDPVLFLEQFASQDKTEYFTGYFSNEILTDIDEKYIVSVVTVDDMTKITRQLNQSMGSVFGMIKYFALIMAAMLIYLLTKLILEKNSNSISMVKILGYENGEIAKLYLMSTTWVVVFSTVIGLLVSTIIMGIIYRVFMMSYSGWITLKLSPSIYPVMLLMILAAYGVVALLQFRKIQKIPMDEALKNVE